MVLEMYHMYGTRDVSYIYVSRCTICIVLENTVKRSTFKIQPIEADIIEKKQYISGMSNEM